MSQLIVACIAILVVLVVAALVKYLRS
jgi:hypothetical protein